MGRERCWGHRQLYAILLGVLVCQFLVPAQMTGEEQGPGTLGPPYDIDAFYVPLPGIVVDGNLNEPAWSNPNVTVTTTGVFNGYNLTIKVFHNNSYLFVGVMMWGDIQAHPQDFCHICFDADNDDFTPPEAMDLKVHAEDTSTNDDYDLSYGDGVDWTPVPWPPSFGADAEMQDVATYEFQVPVSEAWGEPVPTNGKVAGFIVHTHHQGVQKQHVWWPDNGYNGETPPIEYCDDANYYGNLTFNIPPELIPDHLVYEGGDDQGGTVDTNLTYPFQMRVVNYTGETNISGAIVNYTIYSVPGGATVGSYFFNESGQPWMNAMSNASGVASATLHLGDKPGDYWVSANASLPGQNGPTYIDTLNATAVVGGLHNIDISANASSVQVQDTALVTVWANDSCDNGIEGLNIVMSLESNPSAPDADIITPASDIGGGVYTSVYTAGKTAGNTDIVKASSGAHWDTLGIDVIPGPLASIDIAASPGTVQVTETSTLKIWANDSYHNGLAGLAIDLVLDANPSAPGNTVATPAVEVGGGEYSSTYTAGETANVTDIVKASHDTVSKTIGIDVVPGPLARLNISANVSSVEVGGTALLTVWANDSLGNPIPELPIDMDFDDNPSGTGAGFGTVKDNLNGTYNCVYTAGETGDVTDIINASSNGFWATLDMLVTTPPVTDIPNISIFSGDGQSATTGTLLPEPLTVVVRNQTGTAMAGIDVWFNASFGGGNVGSSIQTTDAQGQASTNLTLGQIPGLNTLTAEICSKGTALVTFVATGTLPEMLPHLAANATNVVAGSTFIYILSYDNIGTEPAADLWVNDTLVGGLEYVSDTSGVAPLVNGNEYSWHLTDIVAGSHSFMMLCRVAAGTAAGTELANHFTIDYTDQVNRPRQTASSNSVTVTTLAEAMQNTPPVIEGVPDLVVHHDWDYWLDLSPYITDPDNEPSELMVLLSDTVNARVDAGDNLVIVLNYSSSYVGAPAQPLNITVSDGYGSDWDAITVTVTDDFPPEKVQPLPDVTMYEDRTAYPFNITEYFFDRDGDAIFYTYGERHINVTFLWNQTVRLTPVGNWFGAERITFRAKSGDLGALVEDTITVTVLPVNDPPTVTDIPDQEGEVNVTWVLDLSPYLGDIDNALSELVITTDSGSVIANGLNLTFRFTTLVEADIVTVTVSDGEAQAYGQISVTVTAPPPVQSDGFQIPWWLLLPIIIALVILGIFLATKKGTETLIEQAFLINQDGTLLAHATSHLIPEMDSEIFSSMLTAIQDFVKDSFKDESRWELNKLEFGENKIFVHKSRSGLATLALVYKGDDEAVKAKAQKILDEVDHFFGDVLKDWDGNRDTVRGVKDVLREHLSK